MGSNALKLAANFAWDDAHDDGQWYGELKTNATLTAEYSVSLEGIPFPCHLHQWIMHPLALSSRFMPPWLPITTAIYRSSQAQQDVARAR